MLNTIDNYCTNTILDLFYRRVRCTARLEYPTWDLSIHCTPVNSKIDGDTPPFSNAAARASGKLVSYAARLSFTARPTETRASGLLAIHFPSNQSLVDYKTPRYVDVMLVSGVYRFESALLYGFKPWLPVPVFLLRHRCSQIDS